MGLQTWRLLSASAKSPSWAVKQGVAFESQFLNANVSSDARHEANSRVSPMRLPIRLRETLGQIPLLVALSMARRLRNRGT
jgi:hypothetical protein